MEEQRRVKLEAERKLKEQWAAARGDASKSASMLAFEEQKRQEMKQHKEETASKLLGAQAQQFRLEREAFERSVEEHAQQRREEEGKRVREMVLIKQKEAEKARARDVAEATLEMKLHTEADLRDATVLEKTKQSEAIRARKMTDEQREHDKKLKEEAKEKQRKVDRERNAKGHESSIAVKKMKDAQEADVVQARRVEWIERQRAHDAEVQAEIERKLEIENEFNIRPHGQHMHTPLGDSF